MHEGPPLKAFWPPQIAPPQKAPRQQRQPQDLPASPSGSQHAQRLSTQPTPASPACSKHSCGPAKMHKRRADSSSKAGQGHAGKPKMNNSAQPTGHPMTRWRGSLRSETPLQGKKASGAAPKFQKPAQQASAVGATSASDCAGKSSDMPPHAVLSPDKPSQFAAADRRSQHEGSIKDDGSGHGHHDVAQPPEDKALHQQGCLTSQQSGAALATAEAAAEQKEAQHETPAASPVPCQHLKQRYLPVYSMFDGDVTAADDMGDLCWEQIARQLKAEDAERPPESAPATAAAGASRQHAPRSSASWPTAAQNDTGDRSDGLQAASKCSTPGTAAVASGACHMKVEEDSLRAAMQKFAIRVK